MRQSVLNRENKLGGAPRRPGCSSPVTAAGLFPIFPCTNYYGRSAAGLRDVRNPNICAEVADPSLNAYRHGLPAEFGLAPRAWPPAPTGRLIGVGLISAGVCRLAHCRPRRPGNYEVFSERPSSLHRSSSRQVSQRAAKLAGITATQ